MTASIVSIHWSRALTMALLLAPLVAVAQKIYTCQDSSGRRLTSDRPIFDCNDREQRILGNDGVMRKVLPPSQSLQEKRDAEAARRQAAIDKAKEEEAGKRDQALLVRYPNPAAHKRNRNETLEQLDLNLAEVKEREKATDARLAALIKQLSAYGKPNNPAPLRLRQEKVDVENERDQLRLMVKQQIEERARIEERFYEESRRLRPLWASSSARR